VVGVACIAPYSGVESGCQDVPLPSRSIGTARSVESDMLVPPMPMLVPGIGAAGEAAGVSVARGAGDVAGTAVGMGIGMPGMGAVDG
jgi:hypothetical protein